MFEYRNKKEIAEIFLMQEKFLLPTYCEKILRKSESQTLLCSQKTRENLRKLTHQHKVNAERLIVKRHARYDYVLVPTASSSFVETYHT